MSIAVRGYTFLQDTLTITLSKNVSALTPLDLTATKHPLPLGALSCRVLF